MWYNGDQQVLGFNKLELYITKCGHNRFPQYFEVKDKAGDLHFSGSPSDCLAYLKLFEMGVMKK